MKNIVRLSAIGTITGLVFGLLLKWIESFTGKKVYVLLLNVDYFPVIKNWKMSEPVEFLLHLFVSIIVVILLYYSFKLMKQEHRISLYIWANTLIGCLLFLTTSFSNRTPALQDIIAFVYWVGAHSIYGIFVGIMIYLLRTGREEH